LVFDIETTTGAAQRARFGTYQLPRSGDLQEQGIFVGPDLPEAEEAILRRYALSHNLKTMSLREFVENILFGIAYEFRASIIGFNLPFDLSRLAVRWARARGKTMSGGYSLQLTESPWKPRVQIKHLSARAALIQFTNPRKRLDTKQQRKKGIPQTARRGAFIDVKTIAAALTSTTERPGQSASMPCAFQAGWGAQPETKPNALAI
jgi:hypothetical protein